MFKCTPDTAGSEWQYWLLFYSIPVLNGLLDPEYYIHYSTLVCAMAILLGESITEQQLIKADTLLNLFYKHCAQLYGKNFGVVMV